MMPLMSMAVDREPVSQYEQMRVYGLDGDSVFRSARPAGVALFLRSGMARWLLALRTSGHSTASPLPPCPAPPGAGEAELIRVLGEMVLNTYR
jgi:hypothetical protein